jgi:hypothetical protein
MLLGFVNFANVCSGKAALFVWVRIQLPLRIHCKTALYFETKELLGKI